ncbi:lipopolysaccharide assembly protein LapA domain-containing protein [Liquorilactobacillus nagelii]|uniref:lipopolysaccharide assembly protein LapA domain-containing protein n=1 Tax=Liquorilactobacillus nagelii TaxID=82688 RepID=UPI0039EAFF1E
MKNQWRLLSAIFLTLIIVVFALLNTQKVKLDLFLWQPEFPLVLVVILAVLLGVLIAVLLSMVTIYQLRKEIKEFQTREAQLDAEYQKKLTDTQVKYQQQINQLKNKIAKQ